eukprot:3320784-Prymnesium_polylepis.1
MKLARTPTPPQARPPSAAVQRRPDTIHGYPRTHWHRSPRRIARQRSSRSNHTGSSRVCAPGCCSRARPSGSPF